MFLGYYLAYTAYLVLGATQSTATRSLEAAMLWVVIPLTVLTLSVGVLRTLRDRRSRGVI